MVAPRCALPPLEAAQPCVLTGHGRGRGSAGRAPPARPDRFPVDYTADRARGAV